MRGLVCGGSDFLRLHGDLHLLTKVLKRYPCSVEEGVQETGMGKEQEAREGRNLTPSQGLRMITASPKVNRKEAKAYPDQPESVSGRSVQDPG